MTSSCPKLDRQTILNYYYHGRDYIMDIPELGTKYSQCSQSLRHSINANESLGSNCFKRSRVSLSHRSKRKGIKLKSILKMFRGRMNSKKKSIGEIKKSKRSLANNFNKRQLKNSYQLKQPFHVKIT